MKILLAAAVAAMQAIGALPGPLGAGLRDAAAQTTAVHAAATYDAFPSIERLGDRHLVVTFRIASGHISPDGRIALARSRDGGRTWSSKVVYDDPRADDRPHLGLTRLADGTLMLPFFKHDGTAPTGAFVITSRNGGRSWGPPRALPAPASGWLAVYGRPLELRDGRLLLPAYRNLSSLPETPRYEAVLFVSRDRGRTWRLRAPIGDDLSETSVADLGGGRLVAMARGGPSTGYLGIYELRSRDAGRTWGPRRLVIPGGVSPDLIRTRRGLLLCAADRVITGQVRCYRSARRRRWSPGRTIFTTPGSPDFGYPASVAVGRGRVFTVYYDAAQNVVGTWHRPR